MKRTKPGGPCPKGFRGLHVLCEVTAAISVDECRELVEAAARSSATCMLAENHTFRRPNQIIKDLVAAGLSVVPCYAEGEYIHELKGLMERTPWRRRRVLWTDIDSDGLSSQGLPEHRSSICLRIDSKGLRDARGKQGAGGFGIEAKPTLEIDDAFVGCEARPGEAGFAGLAHDAVRANLDFGAGQAVAPGRRSGGGHAIRGEEGFPRGLGAEEIFQDRGRQVDSIGDEEGHEFIAREEALGDIVVPMEYLRDTVTKVRAEAGPGFDGGVDLGIRGVCVAEGNMHALRDEFADHLRGPGPFWSEGHKSDVSVRSVLKSVEIGEAWWSHPLRVVGTAIARFGGNPRTLEMVTAGGLGDRG